MHNPDLAHLRHQQTLAGPLLFVGIGLHSGSRATTRIYPAGGDEGIRISRRDLPPQERDFRVHWEAVTDTTLCTTLGNGFGHHVATVEHLLSALSALGVDNASIELDGPEIPVMDGSAMPFVEALRNVGLTRLDVPREVIVITRPVRLQQGDSWAELVPDATQRVTVSIDFNEQDIGIQSLSLCLSPDIYEGEVAPARTFGFAEQLLQLRRRGFALGGSIKNAILLREGRVANLEGLRFRDEFVRHKALDVIGDLSLAGTAIIGHYRGNRPGHRLNLELLRLLMNDGDAWVRVPLDELDGVLADRSDRHAARAGQHAAAQGARQNPIAGRILRLLGGDSR